MHLSLICDRAKALAAALDTTSRSFADDVGCLAAIGTLCALAYLLLGMA